MVEGNIYNKIKELEQKATKFEYMKGRYMEYAAKLKEIRADLDKVIVELDPIASIKTRGSYTNMKPIFKELSDYIRAGRELKMDFIAATYPNLNKKQIYLMFSKLRKLSFVADRRDRKGVVLYLKAGVPEDIN